jgi:anion-transporting  ArsA/GET3 family ATPase
LLDARLLFVTGKGGVGKTTFAAALALLAASTGRTTMLCAMERASDLEIALGTPPLRYQPQTLAENLSVMAMDTEAALREYLTVQAHLPPIGRIGAVAEAFDFLAAAAPGVREILTIGKLCYEVRERTYDLIVVDATASGHFIGHLAAPVGIDELAGVGVISDQTRWMLDILEDPVRTGVIVVTTPEEMPVNETLELIEHLTNETKIALAAVIANKVLPTLFGARELSVFETLRTDTRDAEDDGLFASDADALAELISAADLAIRLRRHATGHLERLRAGLSDVGQLVLLPQVFGADAGDDIARRLAGHLADEISS